MLPKTGNHYYRLKQSENNARFEYSETKVVIVDRSKMELQLFPDLLSDVLNRHISDHCEEGQYHLFDADGNIVQFANLNEEQYQ